MVLALRPGQVVLFQLPGAAEQVGIEVGMVLTVWKGVRTPKQSSIPCHIDSCVAFRAVALDAADTEQDWL